MDRKARKAFRRLEHLRVVWSQHAIEPARMGLMDGQRAPVGLAHYNTARK
jgi:hypothetical protein